MSDRSYSSQDLRAFLAAFEQANPSQFVRVKDEVALDYDTTAIAFEFENVKGSRFPVLMNVFGARGRFAAALGVPEDKLIERWSATDTVPIPPKRVGRGPILDVVLRGD